MSAVVKQNLLKFEALTMRRPIFDQLEKLIPGAAFDSVLGWVYWDDMVQVFIVKYTEGTDVRIASIAWYGIFDGATASDMRKAVEKLKKERPQIFLT